MNSGTSTYSNRSILLTVILVALVIRLVYLFYYCSLPVWDQLTVDNYYHHNWAISISDGNILGDTTYFRAPFYVWCLAALYAVFGTSLWVGRLFGLVVGVVSVALTYRIGRRVFDHKVGLIAAAIQAIYPMHLYFEGELLLDPLFTLLLQLAVERVIVWWDTRKTGVLFTAGLIFGLAAITRPTALVLLIPVVVFVAAGLTSWRPTVRNVQVLILGVIIMIFPVTLRNVLVASDPVLISSQGGINFYIGNNDAADGISAALSEPMGANWRIRQITYIAEQDEERSLKPGEVSQFWMGRAFDWIAANPARSLSLYVQKLYHHISNREISNNRNLRVFFEAMPFLKYNPLTFGILFALTVVGCGQWLRKNKKAALLLALLLTYMAVSSAFFFNSRFRLPLLPLFIVLSAVSLLSITRGLLVAWRKAIFALATAIVFGLVSFYPLVGLPAGNTSQHLVSEGIYFMATEDYTRALDSFLRARQIDPTFPETNLNIGAAYMRLGNIDSALYYFGEEKKYNPSRVKSDVNIASISLLQGEYGQAAAQVAPAIRSAPYDITANRVLMRALFGDTLTTEAQLQDSVRAAAARTGNDITLLNEAAIRFTERGDLDAASSLLSVAATAKPPPIETDDDAFERSYPRRRDLWDREKAKTYYQWGYVKGLSGQFDLAIQYSHRSIELDSTRVEAYVNLISGYLSVGDIVTAREVFRAALVRFPDDDYLRRLNLN